MSLNPVNVALLRSSMIANSKSPQQPHSSLHDAFTPSNSQQGLKVASTSTPSRHSNGLSATDSSGPTRNPKHLSTPYSLQSISTESLPALMNAASLRRTNSNIVTTKMRSSSRGGSPPILSRAAFSSSSPSSPISEHPTGAPTLGPASATPAVPPPRTRLTQTSSALSASISMDNGTRSTPSSPPSMQQKHLEQARPHAIARSSTTTPQSTPIGIIHESMDPFESSSTLEEHERRPSSWDIMDMIAIEQLRKWMVCFCVVNFDLEKGQGKFLFVLFFPSLIMFSLPFISAQDIGGTQ
ncbi:hypothetical protein BGZ73_006268 [Actinomortierella ambigua]|nr:hypothetical protein BGZ73_006268 [Actinomortierella ambigua]